MLAAAGINISIDPPLDHKVVPLSNGTEEILFPLMPPQYQVTISYLYPSQITFNQIHGPIYSEDGTVREITVLPQVQRSRWLTRTLRALIVIGIIAGLYALFELVRWAAPRLPFPLP